MAEENKKEAKVTAKEADKEAEALKESDEDMEKMEDMDSEEDEESGKKKKTKVKGKVEHGQNPEESVSQAASTGTISPNMGVPSTQHVFVPSSGVHTARDASSVSGLQQSPSEVSYSKSTNLDLLKESPLYVGLSKDFDSLQQSISKKLDSVEKSFNDRIANMQKKLETIEAFGKAPFYKSLNENINPEAIVHENISAQIAKGKVRYSH